MQSGSGAVLPPRDEIAALFLEDEVRLITKFAAARRVAEPGAQARRRRWRRAWSPPRGPTATSTAASMPSCTSTALSSEEGIILMCLAEALLRIPDADTADRLIAEKIGGGRWEKHLGASDSLFVNASTFGLMLTGRVVRLGEEKGIGPRGDPQAADRALRRAADPPGAAPGHAHPRRQLRARAHHRGGARARARVRGAGLSLLLRHAGRAGQDGGGRAALLRPLHGGDRGDRRSRGAGSRRTRMR